MTTKEQMLERQLSEAQAEIKRLKEENRTLQSENSSRLKLLIEKDVLADYFQTKFQQCNEQLARYEGANPEDAYYNAGFKAGLEHYRKRGVEVTAVYAGSWWIELDRIIDEFIEGQKVRVLVMPYET